MTGKKLPLLVAAGLFLPSAVWADSVSVGSYSGNSDRQLHSGVSTNTPRSAAGLGTSQGQLQPQARAQGPMSVSINHAW